MKKIAIFGNGGHASSVIDAILENNENQEFYSVIEFGIIAKDNFSPINLSNLVSKQNDFILVMGIGDFNSRNLIIESLLVSLSISLFHPVIHPTAFVSRSANLGYGSVILSQVNVGPNSILGNFCILNTKSSVDHDVVIGERNSLSPSVTIAGKVTTGRECFFGIGSNVSDGLTIGNNSTVGANSYVHESIPANGFYLGTPARNHAK